MRFITNFSRRGRFLACFSVIIAVAVCFGMVIVANMAPANARNLSESEMYFYGQNNILYWDGVGASGCYSSSICGSTPEEKYWSALRQHFDEIHAAAAMGSVAHEGGMGPTNWQVSSLEFPAVVPYNGGDFHNGWTFEKLYNCATNAGNSGGVGCGVGVGGFGITLSLERYLHYIDEKAPDLLQYFQEPTKYSYPGDKALEAIGERDFNRLVELEVTYVLDIDLSEGTRAGFEATTDLERATDFWSMNYENCATCGGGWAKKYRNGDASSLPGRRSAARMYYEKYKDFNCSSGTASSVSGGSGASSEDITLIGDSIAVQSERELEAKFPNSFLDMVGSRHPIGASLGEDGKPLVCPGDTGGLSILQTLVDGSGSIAKQHYTGQCEMIEVTSDSLKNIIVWEMGTNTGGATRDLMDKVVALAGSRNLFLVTPYNGYSMENTDAIAEMYRDLAKEHDNVYIVDWNKVVREDEDKYITHVDSMAVHPTSDGKKLMADLIAEAILTHGKGSDGVCTNNVEKGLTDEQAQKLADYYNGPDVDADEWGLPFGKMNCVSFSKFFAGRFTSVGKNGGTWPNGKGVASRLAADFDLSEGNEPRPFAVFSVTQGLAICEDGEICGHTGIVVAVNGDTVTTVEAAYPSDDAAVQHRDVSFFVNSAHGNSFTYLDEILNKEELMNVVGR